MMVQTLADTGVTHFLECGLEFDGHGFHCVPDASLVSLPPIASRRGIRPEPGGCSVYGMGYDLDWSYLRGNARLVNLPTYAFQRDAYWAETSLSEVMGTAPSALDGDLWEAIGRGEPEGVANVLGLPENEREHLPTLITHMARWREEREGKAERSRLFYGESWQAAAPRKGLGPVSRVRGGGGARRVEPVSTLGIV